MPHRPVRRSAHIDIPPRTTPESILGHHSRAGHARCRLQRGSRCCVEPLQRAIAYERRASQPAAVVRWQDDRYLGPCPRCSGGSSVGFQTHAGSSVGTGRNGKGQAKTDVRLIELDRVRPNLAQFWFRTSPSSGLDPCGTLVVVSLWTDQLREIVERTRAELAADDSWKPKPSPGGPHWDIPESIRDAILEELHSGAYQERARELFADDPEMQQL